MTKRKFYAVVKGRKPGIYTEWTGSNGAEVQVKGFVGAIYKGFAFRHEAENWLADHRQAKYQPAEFQPTTTTKKSLREETLPQNSYAVTPARKPVIEENGTQGVIKIYTDGGCSHNPGPGGYGVVILKPGGQRSELSGGPSHTTNNRMELTACIKALEHIVEGGTVEVYSDPRYVVNGMMKNWAKN
jgi:ribonuclease HI